MNITPFSVSPTWFPLLGFPFLVSPACLFPSLLIGASQVPSFLGGLYRGHCLCLEHYVTHIYKHHQNNHLQANTSKPLSSYKVLVALIRISSRLEQQFHHRRMTSHANTRSQQGGITPLHRRGGGHSTH
jgi:hypothetical protein